MADRALLFFDGNNWYHSLRDAGVRKIGSLDYKRISEKVVGPREWIGTRYYVGRVPQTGNREIYSGQRRFLDSLRSCDKKISVHLGRLESRQVSNDAADEMKRYLAELEVRIDESVYRDLVAIASKHSSATVLVEKAVDVMIAVDMVIMAERDEFDAAYLFSADGDFTPAVEAVRELGKKVYAVSAGYGAKLASRVNAFIRVDEGWLSDCF